METFPGTLIIIRSSTLYLKKAAISFSLKTKKKQKLIETSKHKFKLISSKNYFIKNERYFTKLKFKHYFKPSVKKM